MAHPKRLFIQYYRTLQAQGHGEEGHHALIKALENLAGIKVGPTDDNKK